MQATTNRPVHERYDRCIERRRVAFALQPRESDATLGCEEMVPATMQDQTDAIDVGERDPATRSRERSGESNRVAPALLAIDPDNSVLEHASPAGPATTVHPPDPRAIRAAGAIAIARPVPRRGRGV